jgi:hypothetical protein
MDWQLVIALLCVAVAAGFLIRRGVQLVRNRSRGCGGGACGGCSSTAKPVVSLGSLKPPQPRK